MTHDFIRLAEQYRNALLNDVIPFWERHSLDHECGGYFSCLDRGGNVYDTDKFVWLQARQVWTFSMLHNRLERRPEWLTLARHGVDFLRPHGMDGEGNWYFALNRHGDPLVQPYNIFSDCFAAMAFSQFSLASGDQHAGEIALRTFRNILRRWENPKGRYSKIVPGTRPLRSYALPMILSNLTLELEWQLPAEEVNETIDRCVKEISTVFLDTSRGLVFEHVSPDGSHTDCFEGRLLIPGHGIEGMWFLMDVARRRNDAALTDLAVETTLHTLEYAWDREHGGIFYFLDADGKPPDKLEWDQKLWWVHVETLVALLMGYLLTGREEVWEWFERIHDYTWSRFPDPEYGEWFGYLNRRGEVLLPLKGGKWKGCFHVPRALFLCQQLLNKLAASNA